MTQRERIVGYLSEPMIIEGGGLHNAEIAYDLGIPVDSVRRCINELKAEGRVITSVNGFHTVPCSPSAPSSPSSVATS